MLHFLLLTYISFLVAKVQALPNSRQIITSRTPFSALLILNNVRPHSKITISIPLNLGDAVYTPPYGLECVIVTRNIFFASSPEISSIACKTGESEYARLQLEINGTLAFETARFPVSICPDSTDIDISTRCWTNEEQWRSPTAYDRLMSCQIVAFGVLLFWVIVGLMICSCVCRQKNYFYTKVPNKKYLLKRRRTEYCDDEDGSTGGESESETEVAVIDQ